LKSPRYRWLTPEERAQAVEDKVLAEVASPVVQKLARRKKSRTADVEEFSLSSWRLPEKYRKRYSPRGLDLSDSAIAKMTKGCDTRRLEEL